MKFLILYVMLTLARGHNHFVFKNMEDTLLLNPAERKLIKTQGFCARPSNYENFYDLYEAFSRKSLPLYITADPLLHVSHILYDYALRSSEINYFYPSLCEITQFMVKEMRRLGRVKHREISEIARRNLAYFEVALKLLDDKFVPDEEVREEVLHDVDLIYKHEGFDSSSVMGIYEDFSQYVPRGHYTRNETFKKYFRAMMWYGRISFYFAPRGKELKRNITHARQAILITKVLMGNPQILEKWKSIYEPTVFLVGKTDDISPLDLIPLIEKYFPDFPLGFQDDEKIKEFMTEALKIRKPKIFSTYFTDSEKPEITLVSFRFMGQRFVPDSYMFQNLVYDAVGTRGKPRLFPKGLDILAVMNVERVEKILREFYNEFSYYNYGEMLDSLRKEFSQLTYEDWHQNAYYHWLYIMKEVNNLPEGELPLFMVEPAYADKLLVTSLAYWAELRHDTILYAKQSYTAKVTAIVPREGNVVYVEPLPNVYRELKLFADNLKNKLSEFGVLDPEIGRKLESFSRLLEKIYAVSEKELKGISPDEKEVRELYRFGKTLKYLVSIKGEERFTTKTDKKMAIIADVHTDPNTKMVLEEGVGNPFIIYAVIPFGDENYLAFGGMFSYFEFTHPMESRLTDEKWQDMQPCDRIEGWMRSFVVTK